MRTSLKKIMAGTTAVALVAMNGASFMANAAGVNDGVAVVTPATGIVVTSALGGFATSCVATITETKNDGTVGNVVVDSCTVTDGNNITIAANTVAANKYYTVTFASNGVFGAATVGDTTNDVAVTAYVAPILTMAISDNAIDFGQLIPGVPNTKTLTIDTASNAKDGITVSVASTGLATGAAGTDFHIGALARAASVATTGTDTYQIQSTAVNGGTVHGLSNVAATQSILVANNVAKSNDTTTVNLTATVDSQTEAGNYNDTLTFTVTSNF